MIDKVVVCQGLLDIQETEFVQLLEDIRLLQGIGGICIHRQHDFRELPSHLANQPTSHPGMILSLIR